MSSSKTSIINNLILNLLKNHKDGNFLPKNGNRKIFKKRHPKPFIRIQIGWVYIRPTDTEKY